MIEFTGKKLYICDPLIKTWPEDGFLTGLVLTNNFGYDWIMNVFMQINGYREESEANRCRINYYPSGKHHFVVNMFDYCPLIIKYTIDAGLMIELTGSMENLIKFAIDRGYFISMVTDQAFRFEHSTEMSGMTKHPMYIGGYNMERKSFFVHDCFDNYKYSEKEILFSDVEDGYNNMKNRMTSERTEHCCFYKVNKREWKYDMDYYLSQLEAYLSSIDSTNYNGTNKENKVYGNACYKLLLDYIIKVLKTGITNMDLRSFAFFKEKQEFTEKRINYFLEKGYIKSNSFERLKSQVDKMKTESERALNLAIYYNVKNDVSKLNTVYELIKDLQENDRLFHENLIALLTNL